MTKNTFTFITVIIVVVLLFVAGTGATTILTATFAQTLGEPFFKETGKITGQKEIGPNRTQISYSANGTLKGDINVTNTGDFVSISRGNNLTFAQGQGLLYTPDGKETAKYNIIAVGNITQEGKPLFLGTAAYHTNTTADLAFLNNALGVFKAELDDTGGFVSNEWEWK
jgi:hypothetical protein